MTMPGEPLNETDGPADDLNDADLTDFERQVVELFDQRGGEGDDPADTSPPSPGGGDGEQASPESVTPGDAAPDLPFVEPVDGSGSTPAPESQPVGGQDGAGEVGDSVGGDTPPPPVDITEYWNDVEPEQVAQARAVYDWYSQLDQQAIAQVDAALSGRYVMVPQEQIAVLQQDWELLQQVKAGAIRPNQQPVDGSIPPIDSDEQSDPATAELAARVQRMEEEQFAAQQQAFVAQTQAAIDGAYEEWKADHPYLDARDLAQLERDLVSSGVYAPLAQQHGDAAATKMALDQLLYANPALRDKAIQPLVDERLQQSIVEAQSQQARGQRASAISGSAPAPPSEGAVPMDPDEAMIEEVRRAMQGN